MKRFACGGVLCVLCWFAAAGPARAQVYPINSDASLHPPPGRVLERGRSVLRYAEIEGTDPDTDVDTLRLEITTVLSFSERFSFQITVPEVTREVDGTILPDETNDIGDILVLGRRRIWTGGDDDGGSAWAVLAGVEIPSHDGTISSHSWDPLVGTVFSTRGGRAGFDADITYQFNTESHRDLKQGDLLRANLALQYRLWPGPNIETPVVAWTGLLELNAERQDKTEAAGRRLPDTDRTVLFFSPGIVATTGIGLIEFSVQMPIAQDAGQFAQEDDVRWVLGFTALF